MTDKQAVNQRLMATLVVAILVGVSVLTIVSINDDGMMSMESERSQGGDDRPAGTDLERLMEEEAEGSSRTTGNEYDPNVLGAPARPRPDWPTPAPFTGSCTVDPGYQALIDAGQAPFTITPDAGKWRTWWVGPGDVTVPPPPGLDSEKTAMELKELHELERSRDDFQTFKAAFVDSGPANSIWEEKMLELVVEFSPLADKNPPRMALMMGLLETAMFDALSVTWHYKYCYDRPAPYMVDPLLKPLVEERPLPSYPSEHAAVAGAATVILEHFFPDKGPDEDGFTILQNGELAAESRLWGGGNYRSDIEVGLSLGKQVANRVLQIRADDGRDAGWDPSTRPVSNGDDCIYVDTPDNGHPPNEPNWRNVWPIWLRAGDQFRAPPPPACNSDEWIAQAKDIWYTSLNLTERQAEIADYWEAGEKTVLPPGMNLQVAMNKSKEYKLSTMEHARVLAHVGVAEADSGIAAWDTKYAYWVERPITTINRMFDPEWRPHAVTPQFPGYVSGHSSFTGAGMQVLKHFFPDDTAQFRAFQTDAAQARFFGGIHIRADNDNGVELGIKVGNSIGQRALSDGSNLVHYKR